MHMKRLIQIVLVAALAIATPAHAVKKYTCDFEDATARARWKVNPAANQNIYNQLANKWYIGAPGNNDKSGQNGLYISDDGGATAHYKNTGCWVFAYDTISLDYLPTGDYTLSFDYSVMGNVASNFDGLYVLWIPMIDPEGDGNDSIKVMSIPTSSGTIPSTYNNYVLQLQPTAGLDYLNGTATWRQCAVTIKGKKCDGTPHYLAFVWTNGSGIAQQPGAMVDNINITNDMPCDKPSSLTVTPNGTTVTLDWTASDAANEYEVSAYSYETHTWSGPKIVQGTTTNFTGLPKGQTDFIVRSICDDDAMSLKTIVSKLIYYPDEMCVDYLNLDNATCYLASGDISDTRTFNNFVQSRPIDRGPSQSSSRHTVHFDRSETEPRTLGKAKTIPDGELASVRLGNWEVKNREGAERIEFSFDIDTIKYPVMLLKYMPIIEAPNHEDYENSRFTLDILVGGQSIGSCGQADFNANDAYNRNTKQLLPGAAEQGWHLVKGEDLGTSNNLVWKDWTTVGVNLRNKAYAGKTLTVRLTTFDCIYNAHYGYAYFTLGCSDGKLKGMKCGEINPDFMAPDGFAYRWAYAYNEKYRRADGSLPEKYVLGRAQEFSAGMHDDSLYVVDCMFVQDSTCFFSLYASTLATNPISVMSKPHITKNCTSGKYTVKLNGSRSWVQEIDHVTGDTLVSKAYHIEHYEWNVEGIPYGWSDEAVATFDFPAEGGDFPISLRTTCGTCESIKYDTLHLKPLGPTYETQTYTLCDDDRKGNGFEWKERKDTTYRTYGLVDSVVLINPVTTCDSIIYLELKEPKRQYVDTMVLPENLPYILAGQEFYATTVDTIPAWDLNCDLTFVLNLEVYESLIVNPKRAYVRCEGDGDSLLLEWEITRGRSQAVLYTFDGSPKDTIYNTEKSKGHFAEAIYVGSGLKPNVYNGTIYLTDLKPEFSVQVDYTLTVNYASTVIAQRWNDVLAIRNSDYNGGYNFDSVQWYVNGMPIEGATDFNYYTGPNAQLEFGKAYSALLTRNDGVKLFTCDFIPMPVAADVTDMPSLVPPSAALPVKGKGTAYWYDMLGRAAHVEAYDDSDVYTPSMPGYYILVLQSPAGRSIHSVLVR